MRSSKQRKAVAAGAATLSILGGSLAVAALNPFSAAGAQDNPTTTVTPGSSAQTPTSPTGKAQSNEDTAHEAKETPEQEAAEDSGQFRGHHGGDGFHGGHRNEDIAHEAAETPEREAQEDAGSQSSTTPATPAAPSTGASGSSTR